MSLRALALLLGCLTVTALPATEVAPPTAEQEYHALASQFMDLSLHQSPLAYLSLVTEPVLQDSGDAQFQHLSGLLKPRVPADPVATLLYAGLLSAQAHKPMMQLSPDGQLNAAQLAQWPTLMADPLLKESFALLDTLCQQQNLQACLVWFQALNEQGVPVLMGQDEAARQAFLRTMAAPEAQVRQVAILNYAQQASPSLARFIASLYERGLLPLPVEMAKALGFERDADKAAQWQRKAEQLMAE
ncbi:hypothetical protein ABHF91_15825 [Pseudaeromonas sp. ZJS20]|uniref:hypothetical protein n=1 Tax=Pseudaeromonas aegiceratis TaxID=3153928 RepID=UPI00390C963B